MIILMAGCPHLARADALLQDDFGGDTLDPAWEITFVEAMGWTYEVTGGLLTVTDVAITYLHGGWSYVTMGREFEWTEDFEVSCTFGWDSESLNSAMQTFIVALTDTSETEVANALYHDPWDQSRAHITAIAGDEQYYPEPNMLEHSGQGTFTLRRTDGVVSILWNDQEVVSGAVSTPVYRLELSFLTGAWHTATFGSFTVDQIICSGDAWSTAGAKHTWGNVKALYR
jgi:hypothetical protein